MEGSFFSVALKMRKVIRISQAILLTWDQRIISAIAVTFVLQEVYRFTCIAFEEVI